MSQTTQTDLIGFADVAERLPKFINKIPNLLSGLKQAYIRTPNSPAGLGLAFERATKNNPYGDALLYEEQRYSYKELNNWANQIAHFYLSIGIKKGDTVTVMVENRPKLLATIIAFAKLGVTSALVNTSQRGKVLAHIIELVKAVTLVVA